MARTTTTDATRAARRTLALGATVLALGCATDFDPGWLIKYYRVFGARIVNTTRAPTDPGAVEAAPGETVHVSLVQFDPEVPQRPVQNVWVFCASPTLVGSTYGCAGAGVQTLMGTDVDYVIPRESYGQGTDSNPTITGLSYACAGGTITVTPGDPVPQCVGANAAGWLSTRSISVRLSESAPINHLPAIAAVVMYPGADTTATPLVLDPTAPPHVPHCTVDGMCARRVLEIQPAANARESYMGFNSTAQLVPLVELLQFSFSTTAGTLDQLFVVDTAEQPSGPIRNTWTVPPTPGTVTFVFTAQDTRGGFDDTFRTVIVD